MDKRQPYDWDTRIHLLARGPGIVKGSTWNQPATQVDMAPTFLGLAGLSKPSTFDGKSLVPLLMPSVFVGDVSAESAGILSSTKRHMNDLLEGTGSAGPQSYAANWRTAAFIEYYFVEPNVKCVGGCNPPGEAQGYPHRDTWCGDLTPGANANCWALYGCSTDCYPTESPANNFIVLRSMPGSEFGDTMYAEFQTGNQNNADVDFANPDFHELYNCTADPWQMQNLYNETSSNTLTALHSALRVFASCSGDACP